MAGYWPRYSFLRVFGHRVRLGTSKKRNWIKSTRTISSHFWPNLVNNPCTFFEYKIPLSSRETLYAFCERRNLPLPCQSRMGTRECSGCWLNEQPCTLYQRKRFSIASKVFSRHFICSAMLFLDEVILNQRNKLLQILCLRGQKTQTGFLLFRSFASFWPAKGQSIYCHQVTVCWGKIRIHWFVWRPFNFSARC